MRSSPAASAAERRRAFKEDHRRHLSLRDKWCIRAVASRPLWIPRRESPCDPALRAGTLSGAAFGGKNRERVPPRTGFRFSALRTEGPFFAPLRGAPKVPPSAAEIAGSRPGGRADFLRAQEVGGRRALKGGFKRPARATPGARYARRPLKGPRRPFGTRFEPPTAESFVRKQVAKLAPLENPPTAHVQPAASRRLVPLHPTIQLSEDSQ